MSTAWGSGGQRLVADQHLIKFTLAISLLSDDL